MWRDLFQYHRGHIRRDYVSESFQRYGTREYSMIVSAAYVGTESNGLFYIDQVSLDIHMTGLNKLILDNMAGLECVEKYLNVSIRHEIGHIIDYRRFHERPVEEYVEYFTRYNHQCDEFYRWKREESKDDNWEDELRLYHSIEIEANADINAGLTIEDFLSLETEKPKVNMDITLDINVIDKNPRNDEK